MPTRRKAHRSRQASAKAAMPKIQNHHAQALVSHSLRQRTARRWFDNFAHSVARWSGKPVSFLIALLVVVAWALSGPAFGFSDTWQLVINTSTTIVTFLMVFLIQSTQNRDTLALQIKLAELIIAMRGTHNDMAIAEDMCEADLEALHEEYRKRAEETEDVLEQRRSTQPN